MIILSLSQFYHRHPPLDMLNVAPSRLLKDSRNYGDGSDVHTDTGIALNDAAPYWVIAALEAQHPNMRHTVGDSYTRRAAARRALDPNWTS